ncbi:MAG: hypothetical protein H6874_03750 [Hyphomicrobiaceae bacterium]|nr:hypothetical protein [Hyphomicrobiaceae bacterium]
MSTSYVNQIEKQPAPLTAGLMLALADEFKVDLSDLCPTIRPAARRPAREVFADPLFAEQTPGLIEMKNLTVSSPILPMPRFWLYEAYRKANDRLPASTLPWANSPQTHMQTAYEEVCAISSTTRAIISMCSTRRLKR